MDYLQMLLASKDRKPRQRAEKIAREGNRVIFNQLCSEWAARFSWNCSDKNIPVHLIEPHLLLSGMLGFCRYDITRKAFNANSDVLYLRARSISLKNVYNEPTAVMLTSFNGIINTTGIPLMHGSTNAAANTALLYDNHINDWPLQIIDYYSTQLGLISQRIHAAVTNVLPTILITADESEVGNIRRSLEAADRGVPMLIASGNKLLNQGDSSIMAAAGADEALKTLFEAYDKLHALFLQNIGLSANTLMNKLSGISPIEIARTSAPSELMLEQDFRVRKQCAENINKLLGIDLQPKLEIKENRRIGESSNHRIDEAPSAPEAQASEASEVVK